MQEEGLEMQATMFQPVGGMDRIPAGFKRAIRSPIIENAEHVEAGVVTLIELGEKGWTIVRP